MNKLLLLLCVLLIGCGTLKRTPPRSSYTITTDYNLFIDSIEKVDNIIFPDINKFYVSYIYDQDTILYKQYLFINTYNKSTYILSIGTNNDSIYEIKYRVE